MRSSAADERCGMIRGSVYLCFWAQFGGFFVIAFFLPLSSRLLLWMIRLNRAANVAQISICVCLKIPNRLFVQRALLSVGGATKTRLQIVNAVPACCRLHNLKLIPRPRRAGFRMNARHKFTKSSVRWVHPSIPHWRADKKKIHVWDAKFCYC